MSAFTLNDYNFKTGDIVLKDENTICELKVKIGWIGNFYAEIFSWLEDKNEFDQDSYRIMISRLIPIIPKEV
jgi:hypothetical protein